MVCEDDAPTSLEGAQVSDPMFERGGIRSYGARVDLAGQAATVAAFPLLLGVAPGPATPLPSRDDDSTSTQGQQENQRNRHEQRSCIGLAADRANRRN